jgi:hypothetical protein
MEMEGNSLELLVSEEGEVSEQGGEKGKRRSQAVKLARDEISLTVQL